MIGGRCCAQEVAARNITPRTGRTRIAVVQRELVEGDLVVAVADATARGQGIALTYAAWAAGLRLAAGFL